MLSRGERKVAQLLSGGLSNREIAGRLYLWEQKSICRPGSAFCPPTGLGGGPGQNRAATHFAPVL